MIGPGLKKCRPSTDAGRAVAIASFMIGIDDVFEREDRVGRLDDLVEHGEHLELLGLALDDGLDDELAVGEVRVVGREAEPFERLRPGLAAQLAGLHGAAERVLDVRAGPSTMAASSTSRTTTSRPARAQTSAIPDPISPHPTDTDPFADVTRAAP